MTQTSKAPAKKVTNVNNAAATANDSQTAQTTNVTACPVLNKDGQHNGSFFSIEPGQFSRSIGSYCGSNADGLTFRFLGADIVIPSGKTRDGKERFFSVVKQVTTAIFAGKDNSDKPTDKTALEVLQNLKACGFHFADFTRLSVMEGVQIRTKNLTAETRLAKNVTRQIEENKVFIARTGTANKLNRIIQERGLSAAIAELEAMKKAGESHGIKLLELAK